MTPNTYHEEISDQDVVSQLERMERRDMSITPEKLRELADLAYERCHNGYAEALRAAADEIERLNAILQEKPEQG